MADGQIVAQGKFTSDGAAQDNVLRSDFDSFEVLNYTQAPLGTAGAAQVVKASWQLGMADNTGYVEIKLAADESLASSTLTSGGFLRVDSSNQAPEAAKTLSGTEITAADPAVCTSTAHGYSNGDRVRIINPTSMLQIGGYEFTIGSVGANSFELSYLDASVTNFVAATGGSVRRIPNDPQFKPGKNWITAITKASSAVVTLSVTHGLAVGDVVRLSVPSPLKMVEADGLAGKVTAVSTADNTVTLDIDSSNFTAFLLPLSADAGSPALLIPFGSKATNVDQALDNQSEILMRLGGGAAAPAGAASDVIYWKAFKAVSVDNE